MTSSSEEVTSALRRLFSIALRDTGQSRRVANFLLAWYNAEENGGWDPVDLWSVDAEIAEDMLAASGSCGRCIVIPMIWASRRRSRRSENNGAQPLVRSTDPVKRIPGRCRSRRVVADSSSGVKSADLVNEVLQNGSEDE
jgi:hypothetical protein